MREKPAVFTDRGCWLLSSAPTMPTQLPSDAADHQFSPATPGTSEEELLDSYSTAVMRAVERVGPSVAHLAVWSSTGGRGRSPEPSGTGSAFVFTHDGFLLTNS